MVSSIVPDNIPIDAPHILYRTSRARGNIYYWNKGDQWYWTALGNCGVEATQQLALEVAKRWIRDRQ